MGRSILRAVSLGTLVVVVLTGRAAMSQNSTTATGAVAGGTMGDIIAGVEAAAGEGTPSGELVGNLRDETDRRLAAQAAQRALETASNGTSVAWDNADNGHAGTVTPIHTYQALGGGSCREYETTVTIDGRVERGYGAACRLSDGSWRVLRTE
jgi:surface antigen